MRPLMGGILDISGGGFSDLSEVCDGFVVSGEHPFTGWRGLLDLPIDLVKLVLHFRGLGCVLPSSASTSLASIPNTLAMR